MTTPELAPDEKVCPYCAETIKAAAVRCRFCQSDLPPGTASHPESPAGPPPEAVVATDDPADPVPEDTAVLEPEPVVEPSRPRLGSASVRVVAALAVVCLVLSGLLWFLVDRSRHPDLGTAPNGQVTDTSFRNAALGAASDAAAQALSYSYKSFDADREKARALMGPTLAKQYDDAMDKVAQQTADAKLTLKATVLSAGLLSAKEHQAKVLLFVNTLTTREGSKKQQLDQNRVLMTLTRKDGGWTVSKMDAF
jgi:Mce-associated membrane protein